MEKERKWDLCVKIECLFSEEKKEVINNLKRVNLFPAFCFKLEDTIYANLFFSFPALSEAEIFRKARIIKNKLYGKVVEFHVRP